MESKGTLISASKNIESGKIQLLFELENDISSDIDTMSGYMRIKAVKWREKRSLDANAYYWVLVTKIASAMNSSKEEIHNLMLSRYGQVDRDEDGQAIIFSLREGIDISKRYDLHAKPVGAGTVNGKRFIHYVLLNGSHMYNTEEMSILIDGVISEAKELNIETIPPDEIERMMNAWHQKE